MFDSSYDGSKPRLNRQPPPWAVGRQYRDESLGMRLRCPGFNRFGPADGNSIQVLFEPNCRSSAASRVSSTPRPHPYPHPHPRSRPGGPELQFRLLIVSPIRAPGITSLWSSSLFDLPLFNTLQLASPLDINFIFPNSILSSSFSLPPLPGR